MAGEIGSPPGPQARTASCVPREAHVHGHVPISAVVVRDPTHHAATLGDPVALAYPHRRTDIHFFRHHCAPPAPRRTNKRLVGLEDEPLFGVYLSVLDLVGAGRDYFSNLVFGGLQGGVP